MIELNRFHVIQVYTSLVQNKNHRFAKAKWWFSEWLSKSAIALSDGSLDGLNVALTVTINDGPDGSGQALDVVG